MITKLTFGSDEALDALIAGHSKDYMIMYYRFKEYLTRLADNQDTVDTQKVMDEFNGTVNVDWDLLP